MCEFCALDEFGDSDSSPLVSDTDSLFSNRVEVELRIYGSVAELYIGIGGTQVYVRRQHWKFCPCCGDKLKEENDGRS